MNTPIRLTRTVYADGFDPTNPDPDLRLSQEVVFRGTWRACQKELEITQLHPDNLLVEFDPEAGAEYLTPDGDTVLYAIGPNVDSEGER